ncbi:hypothetical protein CA7LBN_004533 [Candidozyma auris]|uniref:ABC transporter domain-containing protein n=1 Tax=Candidozyma auris TaxID=498019 RepID=A0A8F2W500_CANAR|nr:hypothetical protein CA7LBN_004533 [[Candida] auris]
MVRKQKATVSDEIAVTSESSRFHNETLETLSKDVYLKKVSISVGLKDLLLDADVRLNHGTKYGLIGPNGCGKTTLMKCLGYKRVSGLADNLRILYVEQLPVESTSKSVLETVLAADKDRVKLMSLLSTLEAALSSADPLKIKQAIKQVKLEEQKANLAAAQKTATERTGARGHRARKALVEQESLVAELEALSLDEVVDSNTDEAFVAQEMALQLSEQLKGYDSEEKMQQPARVLSEGWRIRASLAAALLLQPDILLLDEPTNHLDLPTVLWLQNYLRDLKDVTLVLVSHNRAFLNEMAEETIVCKKQSLEYYDGNYDEYMENFQNRQSFLRAKADANRKKKEALEHSIEKGLNSAKKNGDDKSVQRMAARKKKLDRIGMDVNSKGHKYKLNRDRAGYHENFLEEVEVEDIVEPDHWNVEPPPPMRYSGDLLVTSNVGYKYPEGDVIFGRVSFSIGQRARIALIGANGTGKSTLIKLLTGKILPSVGHIERPGNATIGTFDQFNAEVFLAEYSSEATPLSVFMEKYPNGKESHYRGHMGKFGLRGSTAIKPLATLSGGEMARLKLALNFFESSPNLLILDEPTNHLDMQSIESLIELINKYEGAVVIASHDQYFVTKVAKEIYTFKKKQLKQLESMDEYIEEVSGP